MADYQIERSQMIEQQIKARGVRDPLVLAAMGKVAREAFLPEHLREHAYEDRPLPIAEGQTILQPYVVAYMIEALALKGGEKVLEIGAGSGYVAAILAEIAGEVFTIERNGALASKASATLQDAGYTNVHLLHDSGGKGWFEKAPFDAILVSAGAPYVPETLKNQLRQGGRMVVPVGTDPHAQELVRITRREKGQFDREDLADLRFVPMLGEQGWEGEEPTAGPAPPRVVQHRPRTSETLPDLIRAHGETFDDVETADLAPMMARIGDAKVVLIGEASHGTSEFYRMRARITRRLIEEKGFTIVAAEADWPDAARIDHYVRHRETPPSEWEAFARFPIWMWRNKEVRAFTDWLHEYNAPRAPQTRAGFYGLDLYSLFNSAKSIIDYLQDVDPDLARIARQRYGCLSPWEADPAAYGHAALTGAYRHCEDEVVAVLVDLMKKRKDYAWNDGDRFLDAAQNAALVANAEKYYRIMYYGSRASWNLRDDHMFETLQNVLNFHGEGARAVIWAHNSHIGDARVTELSKPRLERAIGVIYRPETELASHYFEAELPRQFDEYIWIDETRAVTPLVTGQIKGLPDTYPFGT